MCGIFAYCGTSQAVKIVWQGLRNLEYRGYDSWGIAVSNKQSLQVSKQVGEIPTKLPKNFQSLKGAVGLGHTRWATNGGVTKINAHPHLAKSEDFAVVHNGIVENAGVLRECLVKKGWQFVSETDTEVIVHLLEEVLLQEIDVLSAIRQVSSQLEGRNTFAVITKAGEIWATKQGSPLVLGRKSDNSAIFLSSDTASLVGLADEYYSLDDGQTVQLSSAGVGRSSCVVWMGDKQIASQKWERLQLGSQTAILKQKHYMLQEILETPDVIRALTKQPKKLYEQVAQTIRSASKVYVVGSGTAGLAAASIASNLRSIAGVEATALVGAEAAAYLRFMDASTVVISPSQSGETADVLDVLVSAKELRAKIITFVNMPGSSMSRLADVSCMADAGAERCVMSTKVFSSQILWGYFVAKTLVGKYSQANATLTVSADRLETAMIEKKWRASIQRLAKSFVAVPDLYLLGTGSLLPIAQEGMVKLIEGTYKHAHALPAGDLKHYAITLMEEGVPVILLDPGESSERQAILTAAHEVGARGARTIGIGPSASDDFSEYLVTPQLGELQAVASVVALQLLSYDLTVLLGLPVDKPRNIAKSVTVK